MRLEARGEALDGARLPGTCGVAIGDYGWLPGDRRPEVAQGNRGVAPARYKSGRGRGRVVTLEALALTSASRIVRNVANVLDSLVQGGLHRFRLLSSELRQSRIWLHWRVG